MDIVLYLGVGALAGLLAGLLGIGGGIIIVAALAWILPSRGFPAEHIMHVALATSLASIVFTALSSAYAHWKRGSLLLTTALVLVPGMLIGGWLGAMVATHLSSDTLRWCVAGFCLVAAWQLAFGRTRANVEGDVQPRSLFLSAWGVLIGAVSAVVGIGGGSMTVPLLVWYGVKPVRAVGTSSACGVAIALASALGYVAGGHGEAQLPSGSWGFVYLPAAAGVAIASVLMAPFGARLAHGLSGPALKRVFAVFLLLMGLAVLAGA